MGKFPPLSLIVTTAVCFAAKIIGSKISGFFAKAASLKFVGWIIAGFGTLIALPFSLLGKLAIPLLILCIAWVVITMLIVPLFKKLQERKLRKKAASQTASESRQQAVTQIQDRVMSNHSSMDRSTQEIHSFDE